MKKAKWLNACLIASSLLGYLEWGGGNSQFLFEMEWEILGKLFSDPASVLHPLIILPMVGQLVLIATLFQQTVSKKRTYVGLTCLACLMLIIFVVGILNANVKMIVSVLPFFLIGMAVIFHFQSAKT